MNRLRIFYKGWVICRTRFLQRLIGSVVCHALDNQTNKHVSTRLCLVIPRCSLAACTPSSLQMPSWFTRFGAGQASSPLGPGIEISNFHEMVIDRVDSAPVRGAYWPIDGRSPWVHPLTITRPRIPSFQIKQHGGRFPLRSSEITHRELRNYTPGQSGHMDR
jgi:hypothetical protein